MGVKELIYENISDYQVSTEPALQPAANPADSPKRNPRVKLPEAGGVAFADLQVAIKKDGTVWRGKITLTARGFNATEALDNLMQGIEHANSKYHAHFLHK